MLIVLVALIAGVVVILRPPSTVSHKPVMRVPPPQSSRVASSEIEPETANWGVPWLCGQLLKMAGPKTWRKRPWTYRVHRQGEYYVLICYKDDTPDMVRRVVCNIQAAWSTNEPRDEAQLHDIRIDGMLVMDNEDIAYLVMDLRETRLVI